MTVNNRSVYALTFPHHEYKNTIINQSIETKQDLKLAVTIDADNAPSVNIKGMMEEIVKYGTPSFRGIYGDM
jgi:hypothetical protein